MRPALIAHLFALVLPLAACGDGGDNSDLERPNAAGEVLGGEISDAMLPLDTVQSTSPVAPRPTASNGDGPPTTEQPREILPQPEAAGGSEPLPSGDDTPAPPQL